jgi:hypothetical protein
VAVSQLEYRKTIRRLVSRVVPRLLCVAVVRKGEPEVPGAVAIVVVETDGHAPSGKSVGLGPTLRIPTGTFEGASEEQQAVRFRKN